MDVTFLTTIAPILTAGVWALIGYVNSWMGPDHEPDWTKMGITFAIGIAVAIYMTATNQAITFDSATMQFGLYMGYVATIDKFAHILLKKIQGGQ